MRRAPRITRAVFHALALVTLASSLASADITIATRDSSEGLGGFGNSNGTRTRIVTPDRAATASESQYTGRFKTFMGGRNKTTQIVRLDKGVVWDVDAEKKTYSELTFDQLREAMQRAAEEMKKAQAQMAAEGQAPPPPSATPITYDVQVKRTGQKQTIAGMPCEQVLVTTGGGGLAFAIDGWYSKKMPGQADVLAFDKAFAEKLHMEEMAAQVGRQAMALYGDALKEMAKKLGDLGYSMKSTFTVEDVQTPEQKQALADAKTEQKKAIEDSEKSQKKADAAADVQDAAHATQAVASGDKPTAGGVIGGFLARKAANAAAKKAQESAKKQMEGGGANIVLRTTTEVVSISSDAAAETAFEVPAGYKKVESKLVSKSKSK